MSARVPPPDSAVMQKAIEQHQVQAELARIARDETYDAPTRAAVVYAAAAVFASPRHAGIDLMHFSLRRKT